MVKKVAIVTFMASASRFYSGQLKELFGDTIETMLYSIEESTTGKLTTADIIVVSTYSIFETIKANISPGSEIVIPNLTFSKTALNKIKEIPSGTKCMLVNSSVDMCIDTISLIGQLGVNDIEFVPVYPGINEVPNLDLAVTPGESKFVPSNVKYMMDIGDRILDTSTIIEIALKLGFECFLKEDRFISYVDKIATNSYSLEILAGKTNKLESQFDILLRILDEGIIAVNANNIIYAINASGESVINRKKDEVIGRIAKEALPDIPFDEVIESLIPIKNKLIKINDIHVDLTVEPVMSSNVAIGAFAIVKRFKDTEFQQQKLRLQLLNRGYRAKYLFKDIIGDSVIINKTKKIGEKMAKTNSPVLITGESGTGKELFAQAIHNSSLRKQFPFVAVNCAAIPDNLLESELFGYEEGAFTGAKKGGKPGLFEFAHLGTLFLDEIEAMSLNLQSKLLRILQEKEVVRIGGDRVISIDVRIIATTNEDLTKLIHQGRFRKDLYYRLNVLPLNIPPLRERGQDVLIIMKKIMEELNADFEVSEEINNIFLNYCWEGNVRELRNYIEYLNCLSEEEIAIEDLPKNLLNSKSMKNNIETIINTNEYKKIAEDIGNKIDDYIIVLDQLELFYKNRKGAGRRAISKKIEEKNIYLSEQEIRTIFSCLENHKIITVSKGRGGSKLTEKGLNFINVLKMG